MKKITEEAQIQEIVKTILPKAVSDNKQVIDCWTNEILTVFKEASQKEEEIIRPGEEAAVKWLLLKGMELTRIKGRFEVFERIHNELFTDVKEDKTSLSEVIKLGEQGITLP